MEPYALKEFQGRWYVVGTVSGSKKLYIFGLDRIDKLGIMTQTFVPKKTIDPTLEFEEIIGVTRLDEDMEDVVLSFTPRQGNYVKTFPWHRSQEVLVDDETELRTRIRVRPNFELTQRILMQGRSVEVIAPDWLRMEIKENLQKTIERYSQATTGNGERII
jgi:predicted DNA-binding transcriptional regulator YafY